MDGIRIMTYYYHYELNPDTSSGALAEQRLTLPNSSVVQEHLESSPR